MRTSRFHSDNLESAGYDHLSRMQEKDSDFAERKDRSFFILDIMMPRKDGFWLAEQIRKRDSETPIISSHCKKCGAR